MEHCKISKCIFKYNANNELRNMNLNWKNIYWQIIHFDYATNYENIIVQRNSKYLKQCNNLIKSCCEKIFFKIDFNKINIVFVSEYVNLCCFYDNYKLIKKFINYFDTELIKFDKYCIYELMNKEHTKTFKFLFFYNYVSLYKLNITLLHKAAYFYSIENNKFYIFIIDMGININFIYSSLPLILLTTQNFKCVKFFAKYFNLYLPININKAVKKKSYNKLRDYIQKYWIKFSI